MGLSTSESLTSRVGLPLDRLESIQYSNAVCNFIRPRLLNNNNKSESSLLVYIIHITLIINLKGDLNICY